MWKMKKGKHVNVGVKGKHGDIKVMTVYEVAHNMVYQMQPERKLTSKQTCSPNPLPSGEEPQGTECK